MMVWHVKKITGLIIMIRLIKLIIRITQHRVVRQHPIVGVLAKIKAPVSQVDVAGGLLEMVVNVDSEFC